jgi:AcrR family transcriptional regulator
MEWNVGMPGRQEMRSEETRQAILKAAGQLFAQRGFEAVTMREIAREAGCSHTTIYIYFKDKEALLHHLSTGPLRFLQGEMEAVLQDQALSPRDRLRRISEIFIRFCLAHRTMYSIFFMARADRVDASEPVLEVNRLRNRLFGLLRQAVGDVLPAGLGEEAVLAYARVSFFTLQGILGTYIQSQEPLEKLLARLSPTFDLAVRVLLAGIEQTAGNGGDRS